MLHELWFGPHVRCLGSICEFAVDGWEKLFGTNSTSFQPKWATERNFNGTNMRNMSFESKNQRTLRCTFECNVWTRKDFLSVCHLAGRAGRENNKETRQSWTEYRVTVRVLGCVNLLNSPTTQYNSTEAWLISFSGNVK